MTTPPPSDPFGSPRPSGDDSPTYGGPPSYGGEPSYGQPSYGQPSYGQPSYGQPSYGQPSYGQEPGYGPGPGGQQQGHGYGTAPGYGPPPEQWQSRPPVGQTKTEPKAIVALVCAIGSWVAFPVLPAIAALLVGSAARRDIDASGGWLTGDGLVTAARWIAWANLVLSLLAVLALALLLPVGVAVTGGV